MKLIRKGSTGAGWSPPFILPEHYLQLDTQKIFYFTLLSPSILPAPNYDEDKRERLEMRWFYLVNYGNQRLLKYDFDQEYFIEEKEINPTDNQLMDIVKDSYRMLQASFNDKVGDFERVFRNVADITDAEIDQALPDLKKLFLSA